MPLRLFPAPPLIFLRPSNFLVQSLMLTGWHNAQIFRIVILFVAVNVMHHAAFVYFAANLLLGHPPMYIFPLAIFIEVLLIPMINTRLRPQKQEIHNPRKGKYGEDDEVDQHIFIFP